MLDVSNKNSRDVWWLKAKTKKEIKEQACDSKFKSDLNLKSHCSLSRLRFQEPEPKPRFTINY